MRERLNTFVWPWRVEGRQTGFHPWVIVSFHQHLGVAVREADRLERVGRFYAIRTRPN